jgi:hypothetical protein
MLHSNEEYAEQFEKLDRASHDLEEVIRFFNEEQGRLYQAKKVVDDLQAERSRLQPLTEADKELVDRLFQEQEGRARKQVWLERVISFASGVVASLVAALLLRHFMARARGPQHTGNPQPD